MTVYATKPAFNVREKLKELENPSPWTPPSFRVDLTSTQTVASSTWTVYAAGTVHWDTHSAYDTSTYSYVVPISGIYLFNATQWWSNKPEGQTISGIVINGVRQAYHYELTQSGGSWTHQSMHSLSSGDNVKLEINQASGTSQQLDQSDLNNGWTGVMVSGNNYGRG